MNFAIRNLSLRLGSRLVLDDITFDVPAGTIVSLVGPNGAGKTSLLRCLIGSVCFERGSISADGQQITGYNNPRSAGRIGYVSQMEVNGFASSVFDTILLGRKPFITWNPSRHDLDVVSDIIVLLGLGKLSLRDTNELSGGERQKVLIARAIVCEPQLLVLDEPTSSLDIKHQLEVLEIIRLLVQQKNISVIMAMHDLNLAAMYSDQIVMIKKGRILTKASPEEVMTVENIRSLYGVDVSISRNLGTIQLILKRPTSRAG